jgi:hypothetical protein
VARLRRSSRRHAAQPADAAEPQSARCVHVMDLA